jgi:hypothetical protein
MPNILGSLFFTISLISRPQTAAGRSRGRRYLQGRGRFCYRGPNQRTRLFNECSRLKWSKAKNLRKGWARTGDVLLTHNATVGRVAIVEDVVDPFLIGASVTYYRTNQSVLLKQFLYWLFCAPIFQAQRDKPEFRAQRVYDASNHRAGATACFSSWPWQPTKRPEQHNNKDHGDHGQGDGNRHNGLLAHYLASQYCDRFSSSGSLAMLMAMRRASSRVIRFAADRRPGSFS